jgi:hypothetical protein
MKFSTKFKLKVIFMKNLIKCRFHQKILTYLITLILTIVYLTLDVAADNLSTNLQVIDPVLQYENIDAVKINIGVGEGQLNLDYFVPGTVLTVQFTASTTTSGKSRTDFRFTPLDWLYLQKNLHLVMKKPSRELILSIFSCHLQKNMLNRCFITF